LASSADDAGSHEMQAPMDAGVPMTPPPHSRRRQRGFTLFEIVIVLIIFGVIAGMAIPRLDLSTYRSDAAAQQVRSVFQTAQRTSLTRQFDVIVSVDTVQIGLRIGEDANNDGIIQSSEVKFWRPPGEGNRFAVPPKGVNSPNVTSSIVGAQIKSVGGLPSVVFHRDGSTSSDMEIYMSSTYKNKTDFRAITLTRSTARTELYRLVGNGNGKGNGAKWKVSS
jgi:prepilin-type N-terminal cleavage/methylation domain-containing protein